MSNLIRVLIIYYLIFCGIWAAYCLITEEKMSSYFLIISAITGIFILFILSVLLVIGICSLIFLFLEWLFTFDLN